MANMTAQEAYRAVLQALTASNLINWSMSSKLTALRKHLGVTDDEHKQYLSELQADPTITALKQGTPLPPASTSRLGSVTPTPPPVPSAAHAAPASAPAGAAKSKRKSARTSEPTGGAGGYAASSRLPLTKDAVTNDPLSLVGMVVKIVQEDESQVDATVTEYDADSRQHVCATAYGTHEQQDTPLPLLDNPEVWSIVGPQPGFQHAGAPPPPPVVVLQPAPMPPPPVQRQPPPARQHTASHTAPKSAPKVKAPRRPTAPLVGPPYQQAQLAARVADPSCSIEQLASMLVAVAQAEGTVLGQLEAAGGGEGIAELRDSVAKRESMVRQLVSGLVH